MIIKVEAYDGKKFEGLDINKLVKECTEYEADLRLKKQNEEAERKAKEQKSEDLYKEIMGLAEKINEKISCYKELTGDLLYYSTYKGVQRLSINNYLADDESMKHIKEDLSKQIFKAMRNY